MKAKDLFKQMTGISVPDGETLSSHRIGVDNVWVVYQTVLGSETVGISDIKPEGNLTNMLLSVSFPDKKTPRIGVRNGFINPKLPSFGAIKRVISLIGRDIGEDCEGVGEDC